MSRGKLILLATMLAPLAWAPAAGAYTGGTTAAGDAGTPSPAAVPGEGGGALPPGARSRPAAEPPVVRALRVPSRIRRGSRFAMAVRVDAESTYVQLGLEARSRRARGLLRLGRVRSGSWRVVRLNFGSPRWEGALRIRVLGRDQRGLPLRATRARPTAVMTRVHAPARRAPAPARPAPPVSQPPPPVSGPHVFPVVGAFTYPGPGGRFGAPRGTHRHQGQDLTAAEGTPLVAVHNGTIAWVRYQAGGAGYYIVLNSASENRDYVYMHLRRGSIRVRQGDRVRRGERIADVGSTGSSSGPHLHFEIWVGRWAAGGRPIDPLPHLRRWPQLR